MKPFIFGTLYGGLIAFLATDGIWHHRLTQVWILAGTVPFPGDRYNPNIGNVELILAGLLLFVAILFCAVKRSASRSVFYPPRRFPSPMQ